MSGMPISPSLIYIGNIADHLRIDLRSRVPVETDSQRRLRLCSERIAALEAYWLPIAETYSVERIAA